MLPHELFLTAVVPDQDAGKARAVLQGITEMRERHQYTFVRHLHRDDSNPRTLDKLKNYYQREKGPVAVRWKELHDILSKQQYIMQEQIDITPELSANDTAKVPLTFPPTKLRVLRWNGFPDPPSSRCPEYVTQRPILEISDARLEAILKEAKVSTRHISIQESYHWWHDNNLEYALEKVLTLPQGEQTPTLASLEALAPYWILHVRVQNDSSPERMQQGYTALTQVHDRLLGVFDFKVFDRRAMDPRLTGNTP